MTIAEWFGEYHVYVTTFLVGGLWTVIVWWLTSSWRNHAWRSTITRYMDEIGQAEIQKRDEQIKQLTTDAEADAVCIEGLRVKIKAMANLSAKAVEVAGNTKEGQR